MDSSEMTIMNGTTCPLTPHAVVDAGQVYQPVSDSLRHSIEIFYSVFFTCVIGVLGSAANIINIVVFVKQGFSDAMNISFLGLAIADLCSVVTLVWEGICYNPMFFNSDLPFVTSDLLYYTAGLPHGVSARITCWITTFITFERCICLVFPLRTKSVFTQRRTVSAIVLIALSVSAGISPMFFARQVVPVHDVRFNKTKFGLVYRENGISVESVGLYFNATSLICCIVLDIVCTSAIVRVLVLKSKWRRPAATADVFAGLTQRDKKVVKLVTLISCMFLACVGPYGVNFILMVLLTPEYNINGLYQNVFSVVWGMIHTFEAVKSSANVLVYYNMNSKFKRHVQNMLFKKSLPVDK